MRELDKTPKKDPAGEENRWQKWWDRLTIIPLYLIIMAALAYDLTHDGKIDNEFILVIAVAMNAGLANVLREFLTGGVK